MTSLLKRKSELAATVAAAERAQRTRPLLHPEMGKLHRDWVIDARDGLRDPDRRTDAMTALRARVEEIVLTPEGGKLGSVLKGDLAAMLAAASPRSDSANLQRQVKVVAGARGGSQVLTRSNITVRADRLGVALRFACVHARD